MLLKLENKYDTVNKTYFKEMKYVDWFSWKKYNSKDDDEMLIPFLVGTLVFFFMGVVFHVIAFVPAFLFFIAFIINFTSSTDKEYIELNSSYLAQLKGDDKPKYYSKWYLEMTNTFEYEKKIETSSTLYRSLVDSRLKELKDQLPKGSTVTKEDVSADKYCEYLLNIEYLVPTSKFMLVKRESDRKHWKNNIPENRILTWSEYKKYKKGKLKQQELLEQAEYIKEFKEYYGLEVKEIEEIIK